MGQSEVVRHAARVDARHGEYVRALERLGWTVDDTSRAGRGFPDVVATRGGVTRLVEFKNGPKDTLTPDQQRFHARHVVTVIRSIEDCLQLA